MEIKILQSISLTREAVRELNKLYSELRVSSYKQPTMRQWRRMVAQKDARLFVAREKATLRQAQGKIIGMTTLRWHDLISGRVGTIEDVVVSANSRGNGYGTRLTKTVLLFAKKQKIAYIDLTSRPERKAANKLYEKFGWKKRKANVYRLLL
ncbi:MAG: GNAT family N-acetyltransferase [Candidatus Spechtbacteria bacterium]|nr:GNAT family N-acetyltransferase [Candidatus Spechtbacteria bacterium]